MKYIVFFIVLCAFSFQGFAQKIKYKDLFVLLNAKRYEEAEPFLRTFMSDEKNKDHANSHFHLGNIYHEKALKADILSEDNLAPLYTDSAILSYQQALILIDDKEIRKNDDFYEEYLRRDLRTGKVEIKLSDIHFDLKKRIEELQSRKKLTQDLKLFYDKYSTFYSKAAEQLEQLRSQFQNERLLRLRGDEDVLAVIRTIKHNYDSAESSFRNYRHLLDQSSGLEYNQQWEEVTLENFGEAEFTVDYKAPIIKVYNIGQWAQETADIIEKQIWPLKEHLITFDTSLESLYVKLNTDSVSVRNDLEALSGKLQSTGLEKFDPNPMPVQLFRLKQKELDYLSSLIEYKDSRDSANVHFHKAQLLEIQRTLSQMDSLENLLEGVDLNEEAKNYDEFVQARYGDLANLKKAINKKGEFIIAENEKLSAEIKQVERSLNYMVYGSDSIPLIEGLADSLSAFQSLKVVEEKYAIGFRAPSHRIINGYFTDINASRRSKVKVDIALDTLKFRYDNIPLTEVLTASDPDEQIYYVLITQPEDSTSANFNTVISKIYKVDGLSWTKSFSWNKRPGTLFYQPDTGDLVVSFEGEEKSATISRDGTMKN